MGNSGLRGKQEAYRREMGFFLDQGPRVEASLDKVSNTFTDGRDIFWLWGRWTYSLPGTITDYYTPVLTLSWHSLMGRIFKLEEVSTDRRKSRQDKVNMQVIPAVGRVLSGWILSMSQNVSLALKHHQQNHESVLENMFKWWKKNSKHIYLHLFRPRTSYGIC